MRLLDTLIKKRDHHLDMARKFQDLIAVVTGEPDIAKKVHDHRLSVVEQAFAQHAANGNGNGNGHAPKKSNHIRSAKFRKAQGLRMKKLWKEKRAMMLRVTRAAQRKSAASRKANNAAAREATV